ncbi:hypothetical protein D3C78_1760880 [compost metagenome]
MWKGRLETSTTQSCNKGGLWVLNNKSRNPRSLLSPNCCVRLVADWLASTSSTRPLLIFAS